MLFIQHQLLIMFYHGSVVNNLALFRCGIADNCSRFINKKNKNDDNDKYNDNTNDNDNRNGDDSYDDDKCANNNDDDNYGNTNGASNMLIICQ